MPTDQLPPARTLPEAPPARLPWPPILVAATVAFGIALDAVFGFAPAFMATRAMRIIGVAIVALAFVNDLWCARQFLRRKTTILPHRAASALVTEGPFRFSRNPIYISHLATTLGLGLLLASPFTVLLTPLLALALTKFAIEPEERHLEASFGDDYRAYMARTPRWI